VRWKLQDAGFRVELDNRNEKMNAKIRDFTLQKVPYVWQWATRRRQLAPAASALAAKATRAQPLWMTLFHGRKD
jgi:threonyl-tRNA synthetase